MSKVDGRAVRPGARHSFHYSNTGFGVLGELVSRLRGAPWHQVLQREVLEPLGMRRTTMSPVDPHAEGFAVHPWADVVLPEPAEDARAMAPAGQLWSTFDDMARWVRFVGGDTGDVLRCEKIAIGPEETSGELFDRVTAVGARVLCEVVPAIAAGTLTPQPQDHANATLAPMLNKEMAEFRLTESAAHIHNWVRGMNPWPCAWFVTSGGKKVKVMECRAVASQGEAPGTVLATKPLTVACADGGIQLLQVVPEGKKPMDGTSFAAGLRLKTGDVL